MATIAPLSTPMRQPFGILNDSKIRSMQSMKNRQNGMFLLLLLVTLESNCQ